MYYDSDIVLQTWQERNVWEENDNKGVKAVQSFR
jgi:hypothetical protein